MYKNAHNLSYYFFTVLFVTKLENDISIIQQQSPADRLVLSDTRFAFCCQRRTYRRSTQFNIVIFTIVRTTFIYLLR